MSPVERAAKQWLAASREYGGSHSRAKDYGSLHRKESDARDKLIQEIDNMSTTSDQRAFEEHDRHLTDGGAEGPDGIDWDEITPEQAWNMYVKKCQAKSDLLNRLRRRAGVTPCHENAAIRDMLTESEDDELNRSLVEGTQLTDAEVLAAYKRMRDAADKYRLDAGRQMIADREI